jgi:hypothetical protein
MVALALAVGLLSGVLLTRETAGQAGAGSGVGTGDVSVSYEDYEGKTLAETEAKKKLENTPISVKDTFGEKVERYPSGLGNYNTRNSVAFRTQGGYGSDMLVIVPNSEKDSVEAVGKMLANEKIYLYGRIRHMGYNYVFVADEVYRGWSPKPKPKSIKISLSRANSRQSRTFSLAEPGKTYSIPSPYGGDPLWVSFEPY